MPVVSSDELEQSNSSIDEMINGSISTPDYNNGWYVIYIGLDG
jgi:hypothetical protein